jgi:hypothetical protein
LLPAEVVFVNNEYKVVPRTETFAPVKWEAIFLYPFTAMNLYRLLPNMGDIQTKKKFMEGFI